MTDGHGTHPHVVSYLNGSQRVLTATKVVADALTSSSSCEQRQKEIDYAIRKLKDAIVQTENEPARKGFSPSGKTGTDRELPVDGKLTIAAADAAVASVLFAASTAVGERSASTDVAPLRLALRSADADLSRLHPQSGPTQGFAGTSVRRFTSVDLPEAAVTFQNQAREALNKILEVSDNAVSKIYSGLEKQKGQIVEAFAKAGELFDGTSDIAVLLSKAWEKLKSALETIRQIAASAPFQAAEQYLTELAGTVNVRKVLEGILQSGRLRSEIDGFHISTSFHVEQVDTFSSNIAVLEERFSSMVSNVRTITAIASPLLSLAVVHFSGPFAPLAVPACYSLGIVAIVLLGLDFTHSGILNGGSGIRNIMHDLQPSAS